MLEGLKHVWHETGSCFQPCASGQFGAQQIFEVIEYQCSQCPHVEQFFAEYVPTPFFRRVYASRVSCVIDGYCRAIALNL